MPETDFKAVVKEVCETRHNAIDNKLDALEHAVHGNGQPGLIERIAALDSKFSALDSKFTMGMWGLGIGLALVELGLRFIGR